MNETRSIDASFILSFNLNTQLIVMVQKKHNLMLVSRKSIPSKNPMGGGLTVMRPFVWSSHIHKMLLQIWGELSLLPFASSVPLSAVVH